MTTLKDLVLKPSYNTEDDNVVRDLYAPCLAIADRYDRAAGYFRANVYREMGVELLEFIRAGGHARVVCSPDIPPADEEAARSGYELRGRRSHSDQETDLRAIIQVMAEVPEEKDCLEMLRLLIERESLDLYIAERPGGIYHRKIGRFADKVGNSVVFCGSGNETAPAVSAVEDWSNDEEFDVFRSWGDAFERGKAASKGAYLERLFQGGTAYTRVRPLTQVEREVLARFRAFSSLDDCLPGARSRSAVHTPAPPVPLSLGGRQPYYYQIQAVRSWEQAGRVGLLCMATGTGKTFTSLVAIRPFVLAGLPVLIVVPSKALLDQWEEEVRQAYPGVPLLLAGGGHVWRNEADKRTFVEGPPHPRLILATMQSASTPDFLSFQSRASDSVLVADEAHRLGSPRNRRLLDLSFSARLGLSATPERLYDPEGSAALSKAFGADPVFDLPINARVKLAEHDTKEVPILGHFLSRYRYDFATVSLTDQEQSKWDRYAQEFRRIVARSKRRALDSILENPRAQTLLIERARIVKKAKGKVEAALLVLLEKVPKGGRWIIYCEDEEQLREMTSSLRRALPHHSILEYHSRMSAEARERTLKSFADHPGAVVSIRCLDEGVDLPAADGGLILASSANPREYIQRRGRLLRKAVGKVQSEIIDLVVLPKSGEDRETVPVSMVRSELARAYIFAQDAENPEVTHRLWRLCQEYDVDVKRDWQVAAEPDEGADLR